ncbi:hypothetical protein GLOIN_2v1762049 [Rhizophagus irregularis DAOM 181602=DAOM 197198]|nr:hypothetical protein GLOIN_2v1762049 [Rhizophagus irregularis DAOM 181602=DAOM 197198]
MEEDYVADSAADARGSNTTPPQQNNADIFSSPPPQDTTALSAPGSVASDTDASMHAPKDKETSPLDAFFLHDPQQLRTDEDLRAIQITDIPFFIKKDDITALFKKYGNIQSCRLHTRANAKVQQARIVYDDVSSIQYFMDKQWAIYCYSTCLRITPCSLTLDQKKSRCEFVAVLSQLPPNTKDVHLAPLVRAVGAMAVNIPLSLNSYKPKRWAYITFKSQQMMDTAMEQSIALQGHRLQWELPENTNKLCHRCGKLGCVPTACPLNNSRGRSRTRNPVAHLKERFNIGQSNNHNSSANRSRHRSCSQSKDHSNSRHRNRSASGSGWNNNNTNSTSSPNSLNPNNSTHLQEDMTSVRARIHALELADQRMSRLELRVFGHMQDDVLPPDPNDSSHMLVDNHQRTPLI